MANHHDKGRRKWIGIPQDSAHYKLNKEELMGGRRGGGGGGGGGGGSGGGNRGCQAIYTPGSGPLKKTGRQNDEYDHEGSHGNSSITSVQDRLKPTHFNSTQSVAKNSSQSSHHVNNLLADKLNNVHTNYRQTSNNHSQFCGKGNHHMDGDPRRKFKKPEQPLYVAKKLQETATERDVINSSSTQIGWDRAKDRENNRDRDWETQSNRSQRNDNSRRENRGGRHTSGGGASANHSGGNNNKNKDDHVKRYSSNRKNRNTNENEDNWRPKSPASNRNYGNRRDCEIQQRNIRQGSEPPNNIMTSNNMNDSSHARTRDTRSVEPLGFDKFQRKPPTGRRGYSKGNSINIDALPPRLQRKYLAENGLDMPPTIINTPEESWNTYSTQPSSSAVYNSSIIQYSQPNPAQNSLPPTPAFEPLPPPPPQWSNTIPIRSRGRGRFRPEELDNPMIRPGTPDQFSAPSSRSHTPNQEIISRSCDRRGSNSTMCTSMESLSLVDSILMPPPLPSISPANQILNTNRNQSLDNRQPLISPILVQSRTYHSQRENSNSNVRKNSRLDREENSQTSLSPSKSEPFGSMPDMPSDSFDWSEEVELSEKLENERLSRSSSVLSLRDNGSVSGNQLLGNGGGRNRPMRKKKRERRRTFDRSHSREKSRENSRERKNNQHNRENDNYNNNQKNIINKRFDNRRGRNIIHPSRESSRERSSRNDDMNKGRSDIAENWRTGKRISICESDDGRSNCLSSHPMSITITNSSVPPGVLVLPESTQSPPLSTARQSPQQRKTLFDPNNPNKPIIVPSLGNRVSLSNDVSSQMSTPASGHLGPSHFQQSLQLDGVPAHYIADQMSNVRPSWYDLCADSVRSPKNTCLLMGIEQVDRELQYLLSSGGLTADWDRVTFLRQSLQQSLQDLLVTDMKFCQAENVEQHFWKILFYNIIEMLRKIMPKEGPESREVCKKIMLKIIDDGTLYFENLLTVLESAYKFKLDVFLSSSAPPKGLGFVGLALISAQKIFLFLGDLARYKEQANETTNYGKSRQWYIKAQQINPKNGRPYNQLALLAHYARRKLDAVYYYMRSLMASNPFHSARESLIGLFDENRKKYESTERKRKEEREWRERARMKEKEGAKNIAGGLRREIWIHPGGKRMRRTTSTASTTEAKLIASDLEELAQLSSVEVNKRFVTSYLHVHGKLITKIGMETFQEAAIQMLREFRALLQHSPLPLPGTRLLQLLALNMFAIETTQLKDCQMEQGYRSEIQERALVVSLQMFNLILERGVALLKEQIENEERPRLVVDEDMQVLLPAIKIWCDWMLCHSTVWNPPPSCTDYRVGPPGDAWSRLATMVNLLEKLPTYLRKMLIHGREAIGRENELDLVRLPEDTTLSGFTPLMSNPQDAFYFLKTDDMEVAQVCLRIHKILFFGQVFLCGLEMPVLKLQKSDCGTSEYVSLVEASSASSPNSPPEQSDSELLVDSYSEGEDEPVILSKRLSSDSNAGSEIRSLIERKEELERRQRRHERHRQRVQTILQKSSVSVEIEVRPRQLVPDTNCFIDYLSQLQCITKAISGAQPLFTLMVPLVVLNELEGLTRGADARDCPPASRATLNPEHIARVAASAKAALTFARSRNPAIRCLTTRGTVLSSSTFTVEEDVTMDGLVSNDDKILATCLSLFKTTNKEQTVAEEGQPRRLRRDVVLLTEDRNLRVKALARDVPVREVPDFIQWAGLG